MANPLRHNPVSMKTTPGPSSRMDDITRSELSSSPSLTFSSTDSVSSSRTPPTPRTPARYPTNLSVKTSQLRPSKSNISPKSGKPYQYQSLEDLLQANGYKETRIFTPDAERIQSTRNRADSSAHEESGSPTLKRAPPRKATSSLAAPEAADAGSVGGMVASLLSGWIPGGSRNPSRVKGLDPEPTNASPRQAPQAQSADASPLLLPSPVLGSHGRAATVGPSQSRGTRVPRTALTDALESALRKTQQPPRPVSRTSSHPYAAAHSLQRRIHGTSPAQSLTPSSSSSTIRPSSRQRLHHHQSHARLQASEDSSPVDRSHGLAPPTETRPGLRHIASAPAVGRPSSLPRGHRAQATVRPSRRPTVDESDPQDTGTTETWFESFSRVFTHVGAISRENLAVPGTQSSLQRSSSATSGRKSRSRKRPELLVTQHFSPAPAAAQVSTVRSDAVLCRSAPSSRSTSRVRNGDARRKGKGAAGKVKGIDGIRRNIIDTPVLSPSLEASGTDPFSRIWVEDLNRADAADQDQDDEDSDADPPNLKDLLSTHLKRHARAADELSISTSESESEEPIARRQRSIRSLRAHLSSNVVTPGVNGVPALPTIPSQFKPIKSLVVRSPMGDSLPTSPGFDAWLNGPDWNPKDGASKKKRGLLPHWLTPKDAGAEQFEEPSMSRGRKS